MRFRLLMGFLAVLVMTTTTIPAVSGRDRDPLAPVAGMEAPQFEAFPPNAVAAPNAEAIVALVNEARAFGVPVAVRVVSWPTDHDALSEFEDLDLTQPVPSETMREMAQAWMGEEPIESSPGAEDGFLMLVIMPEDHRLSSVVMEPGPNALPLNGLTQANIDAVVQDVILPTFANNDVSLGIRNGLSLFSYNNLFGEPERIEPDALHEDLRLVANIPLAGATALSAAGVVALALWIRRRSQTATSTDTSPLSPFEAAALHEGRVNDAVITGGLLTLARAGILRLSSPGDQQLRLDLARTDEVTDPFLSAIVTTLRTNADANGAISNAATHRMYDLMVPARRLMEDSLARRGHLNRDGHVETMWLVLGSGLVGALALFTLMPSILGLAGFGILAILFAAVCIAGTLLWARRRSWTTAQGQEALAGWLQSAPQGDRAVFDTIVGQEALLTTPGGPDIPETVTLVRALRGLGPG